MYFYIRRFRFKKSRITKNTYILFEFYVGDKWRKGKIKYLIEDEYSSLSYVSSLLANYIFEYISKKKSYWTSKELKIISTLTEQYGGDIIANTKRLSK